MVNTEEIIHDLHWMARRYADGRSSYATGLFNTHTRSLLKAGFHLNDTGDGTIWARDGMGRGYDGLSDEEAALGDPPDWLHSSLQRENEQLKQGIDQLIKQCRMSLIMGGYPEDIQAVADELEALRESPGHRVK